MTIVALDKSKRAQRVRLAIIPLLGGLLVAILLWPAAEKSEEGAASQAPAADSTGSIAQRVNKVELWKTIDVTSAKGKSPFAPLDAFAAKPASAAPAEVTLTEETAPSEDVRGTTAGRRITRWIDVVVQHNGRAYANIDDQFATVGDTLADGAKVLSITSDAVTLELQ